MTCADLNEGKTYVNLVDMHHEAGYTEEEASELVFAAIRNLCPEFRA
jgi:hypothetical protein